MRDVFELTLGIFEIARDRFEFFFQRVFIGSERIVDGFVLFQLQLFSSDVFATSFDVDSFGFGGGDGLASFRVLFFHAL